VKLHLGVAVLLLLPSAAFAQGNPGPFGGLFGRTPERVGREFTAVEFRTSVAGQYDDAILVDEDVDPDDVPDSGYTGGGNMGLAFQRQSDRFMFLARGAATYQEFYRTPTYGATTYDAGIAARGRLTTRLEVDGQMRYLRSPFFRLIPSFQAVGPAVVAPGDPFLTRLLTNDNYEVSGGFISRYAKHSSIRASVAQRRTDFGGAERASNSFDALRADAHWRRQLNRTFALHAGYGRERIQHDAFPDTEFVHETIDLGVDLTRHLSLSQRTALNFYTQTSIIKRPITGRRYRLNGGLQFSKFFGRTGVMQASLARNTEFLPGVVEPMLGDSLTASVSGMTSRRTEWLNHVSVGRGQFGFGTPGKFLTSYFNSRFNVALTSKLGVFVQYVTYYYKLPPTQTTVNVMGQLSRQSVTVGINTWIPIVNKVRAPRDPE
jgi:hypothetical protein